jgi:hypothetical protein
MDSHRRRAIKIRPALAAVESIGSKVDGVMAVKNQITART